MPYSGLTTPLGAEANNPNFGLQSTGAPTVAPTTPTNVPAVNTATPSPTSAPTINPTDQVTANQQAAAKLGVAIPGQGGTVTSQAQQTADKYKAGLATAQQSGKAAPTTPGTASAAVNDITGGPTPPPTPPSPVETAMQNDPGYQQLLQDQKDYLSSENQQQSLVDQYQNLSKSLGLPDIDASLVNMKSIMDGSEQDIRNEIQSAGGFATDSQVQALTVARNKVLTQNYNNLLLTKQNAENQLTTLSGLAKEDKANGTAAINEKLNFDKQVSDYYQKFQTNAADAYNKIVTTPGYGYDALYKSANGDPGTISNIEQTLGLPSGSLAQLATVPDVLKTQVVKLDNGNSVLIDTQTGQTIKNLGGAVAGGGPSTTDPTVQAWTTAVLSGNATMQQVPTAYRNSVAVSLNSQPEQQYSPLAASRFTTAATKIATNFINLPQYQLTANGLPYLQRIDAAMKTPGSVSDQDLLDSLTKLNTAGNAISDAQVKLITGGQSFSDMASTLANKFKNGGVLSNNQRKQIQTIAQSIFANYQKGYQPVYDQVSKQLQDANIPKPFWTIPDLNNLSAQAMGTQDTSTSSLPQNLQSQISSNLTFSADGKTAYLPRTVWSGLGDNMDALLKEAKDEGFTLLIQ